MKKITILAFCLLVLCGSGLWLLIRRGPAVGAPTEAGVAFRAEPHGPGILLQYADGQTPLRALRWLPPLPGGFLAVQILTQSDRQRLALFREGKLISSLLVPRPSGVREGFFNFAELCDVIVVPDDLVVLLYRSADPGTGELPLVIGIDYTTQNLRWVHRGAGDRLALGKDSKEAAVFLYGKSGPVLRLPLATQNGEQMGNEPFRSSVKPIELPEEVQDLSEILPTSPWGFLAAHGKGLSSYSGSKGWTHWPMPTGLAPSCSDSRPSLAYGKGYWWQPFPGKILQVKADGSSLHSYDGQTLTPEGVFARDGQLLKLIGADPAGHLWFALATPATSSTLAVPAGEGAIPEPEWQAENTSPGGADTPASEEPESWNTYASRGLERIYRWNPERRALQGKAISELWGPLSFPPGINRPAGLPTFHAESGWLLIESGPTAWMIPLESLSLGPSMSTGKGQTM